MSIYKCKFLILKYRRHGYGVNPGRAPLQRVHATEVTDSPRGQLTTKVASFEGENPKVQIQHGSVSKSALPLAKSHHNRARYFTKPMFYSPSTTWMNDIGCT